MPKQILVIDDSSEIRELYKVVFESAGYTVRTASNGQEGLDAVRAARPDLVIVDVVMPVMDGFEFMLHLRSDLAPPLPPVILISGFHVIEREAKRRGAFAFLPKPVSVVYLLRLVANALADQAPSETSLQAERNDAGAARQATSAAAEAALGTVPIEEIEQRISQGLDWLRGYYGADEAVMALFWKGRLLAISHRDGERRVPSDSPTPPSSLADIITTGSSLVLGDVAKYPFFAADLRSLGDVHSFLGVPVVGPSRVAIGAFCLARRWVEPFPAEDVLELEFVGRRKGQWLHAIAAGDPAPHRGFGLIDLPVAFADSFPLVVEMELQMANREEMSLELAILELVGEIDRHVIEAIRQAVGPKRMAIFAITTHRIALLKRARGTEEVSAQIDAAAKALRSVSIVDSIGTVVVAGGLGTFVDAQTLIHLADLQRTKCCGTGHIERAYLRADQGELRLVP